MTPTRLSKTISKHSFSLKCFISILCLTLYLPWFSGSFRLIGEHLKSSLNLATFQKMNTPHTGLEEILQPDLYWIWENLRKLKAEQFQTFGNFPPDGEKYQRLEEAMWPIRQVQKSNWIILLSRDLSGIQSRDCSIAAQREEIIVAHCIH